MGVYAKKVYNECSYGMIMCLWKCYSCSLNATASPIWFWGVFFEGFDSLSKGKVVNEKVND